MTTRAVARDGAATDGEDPSVEDRAAAEVRRVTGEGAAVEFQRAAGEDRAPGLAAGERRARELESAQRQDAGVEDRPGGRVRLDGESVGECGGINGDAVHISAEGGPAGHGDRGTIQARSEGHGVRPAESSCVSDRLAQAGLVVHVVHRVGSDRHDEARRFYGC